jgi:hypothetical protein
MLALLTDPLSCKALREALTTGGGGPAFCTVHTYLRSLTTRNSLSAPAPPLRPMTTHLDMTLTQTLR